MCVRGVLSMTNMLKVDLMKDACGGGGGGRYCVERCCGKGCNVGCFGVVDCCD